MKLRDEKPDDNEKTEEAYFLLLKTVVDHQHRIDPTLWVGAAVCMLAQNCCKSGIPFSYFKEGMIAAIDHYRQVWEKDERVD